MIRNPPLERPRRVAARCPPLRPRRRRRFLARRHVYPARGEAHACDERPARELNETRDTNATECDRTTFCQSARRFTYILDERPNVTGVREALRGSPPWRSPLIDVSARITAPAEKRRHRRRRRRRVAKSGKKKSGSLDARESCRLSRSRNVV